MTLTVKMLRGLLAGLKDNAVVQIWLPANDDYYTQSWPSHITLECFEGDDENGVDLKIYLRDNEINDIIAAQTKKEAAK